MSSTTGARAPSPPAHPRLGDDLALDTRNAVAGKGKRARRKRTTLAATTRRIHAKATARQTAWLKTGQGLPADDDTDQLTRELDVLYDEHRDDQAGTFTAPFKGKTSGVRPS